METQEAEKPPIKRNELLFLCAKKEEITTRVLFHVTPISHLDSIMKNGLIPQTGERLAGLENEYAIYLFPTYL